MPSRERERGMDPHNYETYPYLDEKRELSSKKQNATSTCMSVCPHTATGVPTNCATHIFNYGSSP